MNWIVHVGGRTVQGLRASRHGSEPRRKAVQPPPAAINDRRRPHGDAVAGTAGGSLPHIGHDVSRFRHIEFCVDLGHGR